MQSAYPSTWYWVGIWEMLGPLQTLIPAAVQTALAQEPRDRVRPHHCPSQLSLDKYCFFTCQVELTVHILGNDLGWDSEVTVQGGV